MKSTGLFEGKLAGLGGYATDILRIQLVNCIPVQDST